MKQYYYTYKITLLKGRLANHYYFGQHQTNDLNDGYSGGGSLLRRYYKKYGAIEGDTYLKEIINFYDNLEQLNQAEYILIGDKYKTDPMCINMCTGGHKAGYSDDYRKKLSEAKLGKSLTEEHKKNIGESRKGHMVTLETRSKISKSSKGKKISEESKDKNRQAHLGKTPSNETKQKMRASHKKYWEEHPEAHNRNKKKAA